ncbi:MAG: hypothetical protein DRP42_07455 [Tenericutes bacterium]|nr:MAG: hypothetical protein DRP42_07455 [Mycoplasmatota bacterium]
MARAFSANQRLSLLAKAKFRCQKCGCVIAWKTFHADHVTPYSLGGETVLSNGQALCEACNLRKGNKMFEPLPWQNDCLQRFQENERKTDFVLVAGTGCGKTVAGGLCTRHVLSQYSDDDTVAFIVVPYRAIKRGWEKTLTKLGLAVATNNQDIAEDTQVIVTTYAGAKNALDYLVKNLSKKLVLVFDEFHHMEETNTWAEPFIEMLPEKYVKRIFLSGTPWREDGSFGETLVEYYAEDSKDGKEKKGEVKADMTYTYGMNVNGDDEERNTVEAKFFPVDIDMDVIRESEKTGEKEKIHYDTKKTKRSDPITPFVRFSDIVELTALDGAMEVLTNAKNALDDIRATVVPKAGGIIFVSNKKAGEAVKLTMENHFHREALFVHSEDPLSHERIKKFRNNGGEWIISIDMVSEGVDIPRLKVVADLSNKSTLMHIIQRWGRVLRMIRHEDGTPGKNTEAQIYFINHAQLRHVAQYIESDIKRNKKEGSEGGEGPEPEKYKYTDASQDADNADTFFKGQSIKFELESLASWILFSDFNSVHSDGLGYKHALNIAKLLMSSDSIPQEYVESKQKRPERYTPSQSELKKAVIKEYTNLSGVIGHEFFSGNHEACGKYIKRKIGGWCKDHKTLEQLESRRDAMQEVLDDLRHS